MVTKSLNNWKIASFYTKDYKEIFQDYLQLSCKKLGLQDKLIGMEIYDEGNWYKNTAQKPKVICNILSTLPENDCLVFLDADCTIEKYPELFDTIPQEYDLGCHWLSWKEWYGHEIDFKELLSGTLFFRNSKKIRDLCADWYTLAKHSDTWEQKILGEILEFRTNINTYDLPLDYIYINTRPGDLQPLVKLDPVIRHYQMSRTLKRK